MSFDVKNTTIRRLFEVFCPHYCMGCGELGEIMCECCKSNNTYDVMETCLNCGVIIKNGHCEACKLPFDRGFAVCGKEGLIWRCVNDYKYESVRALYVPLAEVLGATLPYLSKDTVVVPVPTNYRHVRMRGLDHTWLLGRELARIRGWKCERLVKRVKNSVQVGANEKMRAEQAKMAYGLNGKVDGGERSYVVVDDVWTTGSTMKSVCEMLKVAGARDVTAAVLARA